MRKLLLFSPFLSVPLVWVRRLLFWVVAFVLLLLFLLYFVVNSSVVMQNAVHRVAPEYHISYDALKGNLFTGFKIVNPRFRQHLLAKELAFSWNPNALADKKVSIEALSFKELDVGVLHSLIEENMQENNTSATETSHAQIESYMPKYIDIKQLEITLRPYVYEEIKIAYARLAVEKVHIDIEKKMLIHADVELNTTTDLATLSYGGKIQKNQLLGKLIFHPKEALYRRYALPLRPEAIKQIEAEIGASSKEMVATIHTQGKALLALEASDFNVDVNHLTSHLHYDINRSAIDANTTLRIDTPYAKAIEITNRLSLDNTGLRYAGDVFAARLEGVDAKLVKPLENLHIAYKGDETSLKSTFDTKELEGYFRSSDLRRGVLHLQTSERLQLSSLFLLPAELTEAKANLFVDAPIDLNDFSQIKAAVKVDSNIANIDANVSYAKTVQIESKIAIPQNSLLKSYNKEVKWNTLSPLFAKATLQENQLQLLLKSKHINANVGYALKSSDVNGTLNIAGLGVDIEGNSKEKMRIKSRVDTIQSFTQKLSTLYTLEELPLLKGSIEAWIEVDKLQSVQCQLTSTRLTYQADRKTHYSVDDISLVASMNENRLVLKSYHLTWNHQKFFSTKPATLTLGERLSVSHFWLNDTLNIEGEYNLIDKKGEFRANANRFHFKNEMVDIESKIDIKASMDGNDTQVEGSVVLLRGKLFPKIEGKSFASDSDIVIVQEMQNNKQSPFMQNLSLMLTIKASSPLQIKQKGINIKLKPDLSLSKQKGGNILYLGSVDLLEGGSYMFQEKQFVLAKSAIYFTGDIAKPLLDIKANYQALNHLVTIGITGLPSEPNIQFSSNPSLSREQILSLILFDSQTDGDTHSGNEMMRMMGGAMAKAALSDVGVKVDHLVFGEGNSVEVGKKLTRKITVIYINEALPKVKLKYKHGKHTESVIGVSEASQSYDIVYKRDF